MKATVSIPDPVFKAADDLARRMGVSRSRLYSVALQRFVQDHDEEAMTAKLDEVYAQESSALDPVFQSIQTRSLETSHRSSRPTAPSSDNESVG
ncbi:MAG: ChpI protein [Acidobacteriota bacterium]